MCRVKILIEEQMIKTLNGKAKKFYGKQIDVELENAIDQLELCGLFCLKKLRLASINHLASMFQIAVIEEKLSEKPSIDSADHIAILRTKLEISEKKLVQNEQRLKVLEDENLKQKFEIKRLKTAALE